ncbi:MAG: hypothetical protein HGA85_07335 [Nanoarchaeota archaeon]|nr:hypothetical protein [Nanoarchaeota archaeon]
MDNKFTGTSLIEQIIAQNKGTIEADKIRFGSNEMWIEAHYHDGRLIDVEAGLHLEMVEKPNLSQGEILDLFKQLGGQRVMFDYIGPGFLTASKYVIVSPESTTVHYGYAKGFTKEKITVEHEEDIKNLPVLKDALDFLGIPSFLDGATLTLQDTQGRNISLETQSRLYAMMARKEIDFVIDSSQVTGDTLYHPTVIVVYSPDKTTIRVDDTNTAYLDKFMGWAKQRCGYDPMQHQWTAKR